MKLEDYLIDGAKMQEVCVMAYLRDKYEYILDESYNKEAHDKFDGRIDISRYCNCREQGYTICLRYKGRVLLYVTFFEHRNSDALCVILNKGVEMSENPIASEIWGEKSKWDYDKSFDYMDIVGCGNYIIEEMQKELHTAIIAEVKAKS